MDAFFSALAAPDTLAASKDSQSLSHPTTCCACQKGRTKQLSCGHVAHAKCCPGNACPSCGSSTRKKTARIAVSPEVNVRGTVGTHGNAILTATKKRTWGSTTITHNVKKGKAGDFQKEMAGNRKRTREALEESEDLSDTKDNVVVKRRLAHIPPPPKYSNEDLLSSLFSF